MGAVCGSGKSTSPLANRTTNVGGELWMKGLVFNEPGEKPRPFDPTREFKKEYECGNSSGLGATSQVFLCKRMSDGMKFAAKRVDKKKMSAMYAHQRGSIGARMRTEVEISMKLQHKHLIKVYDVFETKRYVWVILELMSGGELFDYIVSNNCIKESDATYLIHQLVVAMEYIHSQDVIHRDLKPENIMLSKVLEPGSKEKPFIKVIDFGMSKMLSPGMSAQSCLGTPGYIAPEVMARKKYTSAVDMYAIGVITYIVLCGYMPMKVPAEVGRGTQVIFPIEEWSEISDDAKDFIKSTIAYKPSDRLSAKDCLAHAWIKELSKPKKKRRKRDSVLRSSVNLMKPLSRKELRNRRASAAETFDALQADLASGSLELPKGASLSLAGRTGSGELMGTSVALEPPKM